LTETARLLILSTGFTETNMLGILARIGNSGFYWLALVLIGLASEAVALFYQYVLEDMPCVLCIHIRLWVMALIMVALIVLLLRRLRFMPLAGHLLTVVIAAGLVERSYQLLGTERHFVVGECGFDLGLPAWFTPDTWFPAMFQVEAACGDTPELLFGITMAEALIVASGAFVLLSVAMTVAAIARPR
jgi:disulfide bond formation protein DsbB